MSCRQTFDLKSFMQFRAIESKEPSMFSGCEREMQGCQFSLRCLRYALSSDNYWLFKRLLIKYQNLTSSQRRKSKQRRWRRRRRRTAGKSVTKMINFPRWCNKHRSLLLLLQVVTRFVCDTSIHHRAFPIESVDLCDPCVRGTEALLLLQRFCNMHFTMQTAIKIQ